MPQILFDTAIGRLGIAWSADSLILAVQLPEASDDKTRARLLRHVPAGLDIQSAEPPPSIQDAIESVAALLRGEPNDLLHLKLDMARVPPFHQKVYEAARRIPPGRLLTYGELAAQLGEPGAARAVGQALGHNPFAPVVPCHRVLAAGSQSGGFSAHGGVATKLRMLQIERAEFGGAPGLF